MQFDRHRADQPDGSPASGGRGSSGRDRFQVVRRRPPLDYTSRRVQLQLLVLVSMLMLVLLAAERARDPALYRIFFPTQSTGDQAAGNQAAGNQAAGSAASAGSDLAGSGGINEGGGTGESPGQPELGGGADQSAGDPREGLSAAEFNLWSVLLTKLDRGQRVVLNEGLLRARRGERLEGELAGRWSSVVDRLELLARRYHEEAFLSIAQGQASLDDAQKAVWLRVLDQLQTLWIASRLPLLRSLAGGGEGEPLEAAGREGLAELQAVIDRVDLEQVQDDTVFRPAEMNAWFRCIERLDGPTGKPVEAAERVSYLPLYRQSRLYRGRRVSLRGELRMAYRVDAGTNPLGITEYVVFVLKPDVGPPAPVIVYSLEAPAGLPPIRHRDREGAATRLSVPAEVTGIFFKNWLYPSGDATSGDLRGPTGSTIAPLILARTPTLLGSVDEGASQAVRLPSWRVAVPLASGLACLAAGLAWLAYRRTANSVRLGETPRQRAWLRDELTGEPVLPGVEASLRALEQAENAATEQGDEREDAEP